MKTAPVLHKTGTFRWGEGTWRKDPGFMLMIWSQCGPQPASGWGLVAGKAEHMIRRWEISAPPLNLLRRKWGWRLGEKNSWTMRFGSFQVDGHTRVPGSGTPGAAHTSSTHTCPLYLALCISFIGLVLNCIFYNKTVNPSKAFFWVLPSESHQNNVDWRDFQTFAISSCSCSWKEILDMCLFLDRYHTYFNKYVVLKK